MNAAVLALLMIAQAPSLTLNVPEKPVPFGRNIVCTVTVDDPTSYTSVSYDWVVCERRITNSEPIGSDIVEWPDGTKAWFGSGNDNTVVTITVFGAFSTKDNKIVTAHASREVIIGALSPLPTPIPNPPNPLPNPPNPNPTPTPVPTSELGKFIYEHVKIAQLPPTEIELLGQLYDSIASNVEKNKYKTKQEMIADTKNQTDQIIKNNSAWVDQVLEPLHQELNKRAARLKTLDDVKNAFRDIASGFHAATSR